MINRTDDPWGQSSAKYAYYGPPERRMEGTRAPHRIFATQMIEPGYDIRTVRELLGHDED